MVPLAHILGIPVEETAQMFAPVAAVTVVVVSASLRCHWREHRLRSHKRRGAGR